MVKQVLFFFSMTLFGATFTYAKKISPVQEQQQLPSTQQYMVANKDTVHSDSDTVDLNIPKLPEGKEQFKNLFTNKTSSSSPLLKPELNPLIISFVDEYMAKNSASLEDMKLWAKPVFDMMDGILETHGIPKEMKYLAVIESRLNTSAVSWAGAVGPWQFMPATARGYGLIVNSKYDERKNIVKSTYAACKYLNYLYELYGDWLLVIAAYNGGPGRVNSAIKKTGSKNFWELQYNLPTESRNHVKKYIATHYIMEGSGSITTVPKFEADLLLAGGYKPDMTNSPQELHKGTLVQQISGRFVSQAIIKKIEIEAVLFNKLNPQFDTRMAAIGKYSLRLPEEKMYAFLERKNDIIVESVQMILDPNYNNVVSMK